ncbi:lysoplasmalogenase [Lysinibacillus macroides]|uniref:Membrane protein n=1 Tax=Lysinibacillus macroides TaxID=33935 RepID=A0A0M9DMT9_9BACI|nr:lysoplasmalogenase [Lysinibacillus macroides]KOY84109.1 membrane protein [Lysinibacillus macroides]QPR66879.1 lysoplasmalogenase [Lysinibacillus macroides]
MIKKYLITFIVLFSLYYIFGYSSIAESLTLIFKVLPMLLIIILAIYERAVALQSYRRLIIVGLIFCMIGDYTLQWFLVGLTSFLIGHIFYIFAFVTLNRRQVPTWGKVMLLLYGASMAIWIAGSVFTTGETILGSAVIAYISVILIMGWSSIKTGSTLATSGALLFIASDSYLAINKFVMPLAFSHEIIMLTYYSAQLLIALSTLQYSENRSKVIQ